MASFTLHVSDRFPIDTIVAAYPAQSMVFGQSPSGTAADSATVGTGGELTFTALVLDTRYVAYAVVDGTHRYVTFATFVTRLPVFADENGSLFDREGHPIPAGLGATGPEGPVGPQGADGTGFAWRGNYDEGATYNTGDVVFITPADADGFTSFIAVEDNISGVLPANVADEWDGIVIAGPAGPQGPKGDPGEQGAPPDVITGVIRGEADRFYTDVDAVLVYDGTKFIAETDSFTRPQNVDVVQTDSAKITVVHEDLNPLHIVGNPVATPGENLTAVGISAITRPSTDLTSTSILLRQNRTLDDAISYNGATWDRERGAASPFTVTFSANALHVTHANAGSTKVSEIRVTGLGSLRPVLKSATVTATGFDIEFRDTDGSVVTAASTNMAVGISRSIRDHIIDPTNLALDVVVQKEENWSTLVPSLNPTLWARFDEASGTSFNDEIGSSDGASLGTVTLGATGMVVGDSNHAITLDGTQGKVAFANPALIGPWSIHLLWKNTGASTVGSTTYGVLVGWSTGGTTRRIMFNRTSGLIYVEAGGAILQSPAASVAANVVNSTIVTWDGTTQRIIHNGVLIAESVTANVTFNNPFWLGSYLGTSTNYSFKGDMDELIVWDRALLMAEAQQLYVTAKDTLIIADRSLQAKLGFSARFETTAPQPEVPPDQPVPVATPLPDGDIGGSASSYISLAPYRALLDFGPSSPWAHRALPGTQLARDAIELNGLSGQAAATSDAWRLHCCAMFGIDPNTGAVTGATQGGSTPMYMRVGGEFIYVVPDGQPRRFIDDNDITVSGWAAAFEAAEATMGNLPLPADALPHSTGDRYAFYFQPSRQEWGTIYAFGPTATGRATTTLTLSGGPSAGGFFAEFDYIDSVNRTVQTFTLQAPILYNYTATQIRDVIYGAKATTGALFGTSRANTVGVIVTGGPLNVAPVTISWVVGMALRPVAWRIPAGGNFLNAGFVLFDYENAEPWGVSRLSAVTSPLLTANHKPTGGANGLPANSGGTAAATGIDWLPLIIDWNEYRIAYDAGVAAGDGTVAGADWSAPGTDLGHVIAMSIGDCGTGAVFPAIRSDGTQSNSTGSKMKQGALMTFPLTASTARILPTAPELMPLFNTIQRYGMIPIDKTGGGAEIIFRGYAWPGVSRPFPGPSTFKLGSANYLPYMRRLPWESLQFIDPAAVQAGW